MTLMLNYIGFAVGCAGFCFMLLLYAAQMFGTPRSRQALFSLWAGYGAAAVAAINLYFILHASASQ